jgi:hypothetical protein
MPSFALRFPHTIIVGALITVPLGLIAFSRMRVDVFPSLKIPAVVVATFYPGMPPLEMDRDITTRFERFLTLGSDIEHIESRSLPGVSIIKVFFQAGRQHRYGRRLAARRQPFLAAQHRPSVILPMSAFVPRLHRQWHPLCGHDGGIYNPAKPNDRLLPGLKRVFPTDTLCLFPIPGNEPEVEAAILLRLAPWLLTRTKLKDKSMQLVKWFAWMEVHQSSRIRTDQQRRASVLYVSRKSRDSYHPFTEHCTAGHHLEEIT